MLLLLHPVLLPTHGGGGTPQTETKNQARSPQRQRGAAAVACSHLFSRLTFSDLQNQPGLHLFVSGLMESASSASFNHTQPELNNQEAVFIGASTD